MIEFASANRDDRRFDSPDEIDIDRKGLRNHVDFGAGVHYCLGAALARLELKISLNRILDRMRNIRLNNAGKPLAHQVKIGMRTLVALPVKFEKII
jgi:cytochrome P450